MTVDRIIELLNIEHECMLRGVYCDRNCGTCDLVQNDKELDEMYTDAIKLLESYKEHKEKHKIIKCKDCRMNNQCSIQFKFADAEEPGEWFCAYGRRE